MVLTAGATTFQG